MTWGRYSKVQMATLLTTRTVRFAPVAGAFIIARAVGIANFDCVLFFY